MRPQNTVAYADVDNPPDAAALAAGYGVGIAKSHPFVDGNKHAVLLAVDMFLYINGMRLRESQAEATVNILAVSAVDMPEEEFAAWLRAHSAARA